MLPEVNVPLESKNQGRPIDYLDSFKLIQNEWEEVFSESTLKSPFLSFEFLKLWYSCFSAPDQVRIYRASDGDRTIGFLPLVRFRRSHIRILSSLNNDHCFHNEPLVRKGYEEVFPKLILKELINDQNEWDLLCHKFSYSFSQFPGLFSDDLLSRIDIPWERRIEPTYTVFLKKSFKEYFRGDLTLNTRKNFMRYKNRLDKAGDWTLGHYQGADAVRLWPEFVRIEDSGWKGEAGSSIKKTAPNFQRYYNELVRLLADKKALHIYFLELNGKPISGVFGYTEGHTFHWAKTGYDEEYRALSPSNLLILYIIEHLIFHRPEIKIFHMFPWDYNYKHKFVNGESSCYETVLFSKTIRGKATRAILSLKKRVKSFLTNKN